MISMDFAKSSVLNKEMRIKSQGSSSSDVLVTSSKGEARIVVFRIENIIEVNSESKLKILSVIIIG